MKVFRTPLEITPSKARLNLKMPVLTAGSCFADVIGNRLAGYKFSTLINPFGTAYNPISIHKDLLKAILNEPATPETFLENNGLYLNYDFHSSLSAKNQRELAIKLTQTIGVAHHFLTRASYIMITYGTAWIYSRVDTGEVVSNCHKLPAKNFEKTLLAEREIVESFDTLYSQLKKFNNDIRIIVTVSPVRHLKDSLELNSVSKGIVRSACHSITTKFTDVDYFPAFEIMMDDLRDYRFYKSDMIHPNDEAEQYIWEAFAKKYLDSETIEFCRKWDDIQSALQHKAFHPDSPPHQEFLLKTLKKLEALKSTVDVQSEISQIRSQMARTA